MSILIHGFTKSLYIHKPNEKASSDYHKLLANKSTNYYDLSRRINVCCGILNLHHNWLITLPDGRIVSSTLQILAW